MAPSLYELLHQCTVQVSVPKRSQGTGFFIAPGLVLTCAHVVEAAQNNATPVEICYNGQVIEAQIQEFRDPSYPDLALLQVKLPEHPCVLLHGGAEPFSELYSYGYPDIEPDGASTTFACEGWAGDQQELLKFKTGQVRPGMSGSPLLNRETGSVCGIVQFTRDLKTDLGGKAMLTKVVLREFPQLEAQQKQFHQQNNRWMECLTQQQRQQLQLNWLPAPTPTGAIEVFFSYAPEDEALRDELAKQLKLMKRQGLITDWYAGDTGAGIEKKQEAKAHLDAARIILLLVSPDFIASDYQYDVELKRALERHDAGTARVIPIILRHTEGWKQTDFGKLQALPRNDKPIASWKSRDEAFYEVVKDIRKVVEGLKNPNP